MYIIKLNWHELHLLNVTYHESDTYETMQKIYKNTRISKIQFLTKHLFTWLRKSSSTQQLCTENMKSTLDGDRNSDFIYLD